MASVRILWLMCFLPQQTEPDTCAGDQCGNAGSLPDQQPPRRPPRFGKQFDSVRQAEQDQPGGGDVAEWSPRGRLVKASPGDGHSKDRPPDQFKRIDEIDVCQRLLRGRGRRLFGRRLQEFQFRDGGRMVRGVVFDQLSRARLKATGQDPVDMLATSLVRQSVLQRIDHVRPGQ